MLLGLGKDDLGPGGGYPPILPVVVYNGERHWSAPTDIRDLFAPVPGELLGYLPGHRYLVVDVQALDPSVLRPDNVLAMIAKFEQAGSPEDLEQLVAPLADLLDRAGEPKLVESFRAWITLVVAQRFGSAGRDLELHIATEEEREMTTLIERARKWGEERDQKWLEKGIEQGRVEGLERERALVRRLAVRRFGPTIAESLAPRLDELSDSDRIAAVADAVIESETAEEFLARVREA